MKIRKLIFVSFFCFSVPTLYATPIESEIGVVVMHGKGGQPGRHVDVLESAFKRAGFQVANLEMPWSKRRGYDVNMQAGVDEITRALDAMRAKGARKVFLSGHSQGGLFALHYAGVHQVDGVIPIAPGGMVDGPRFMDAVSAHIEKAKQMVSEGRGGEKSAFGDYEGSRGTNSVATTAAIYLDWFDPNGAHTTRVFKTVKAGTPVLYVAPTRDYPILVQRKQEFWSAIPTHPKSRLFEPNSNHLGAPTAGAEEAVKWIREIAGQ